MTIAILTALVLLVAVLWIVARRGSEGPERGAANTVEPGWQEPDAAPPDSPTAQDEARSRDPVEALAQRSEPWAVVDLHGLKTELPDNLFWKMAEPTKDPEVLRWREEERDRRNLEYGKVLSGTATKDEVDNYYAYRYRLSSDYVQFATYLLSDYGEKLPQRDVALLKLAIEMHMARLEELPRQVSEAHERREAHDAARRAWLEDQKKFGSDGGTTQ